MLLRNFTFCLLTQGDSAHDIIAKGCVLFLGVATLQVL